MISPSNCCSPTSTLPRPSFLAPTSPSLSSSAQPDFIQIRRSEGRGLANRRPAPGLLQLAFFTSAAAGAADHLRLVHVDVKLFQDSASVATRQGKRASVPVLHLHLFIADCGAFSGVCIVAPHWLGVFVIPVHGVANPPRYTSLAPAIGRHSIALNARLGLRPAEGGVRGWCPAAAGGGRKPLPARETARPGASWPGGPCPRAVREVGPPAVRGPGIDGGAGCGRRHVRRVHRVGGTARWFC